MVEELNHIGKGLGRQRNDANNHVSTVVFKPSTFATVRASKTAPVQAEMDRELPNIIGSSFLLVAVDRQISTNQSTGAEQNATVYTVRVISKKAKAFRNLIQIKVKNSRPIVSANEIDRVMLQLEKPIILRFDSIAHYAYMGGETLNAAGVEKINVKLQDAMNHD